MLAAILVIGMMRGGDCEGGVCRRPLIERREVLVHKEREVKRDRFHIVKKFCRRCK